MFREMGLAETCISRSCVFVFAGRSARGFDTEAVSIFLQGNVAIIRYMGLVVPVCMTFVQRLD